MLRKLHRLSNHLSDGFLSDFSSIHLDSIARVSFLRSRSGSRERQFSTIPVILKLRKETSLSLVECKKALEESGQDYEKALKWLQDYGNQLGATKAEALKTRPAKEGWVSVCPIKDGFLVTELNCQTDFVSHNDIFHHLLRQVQDQAITHNLFSTEDLVARSSIQQLMNEAIAKLGENIQLSRVHVFKKHLKDDIIDYFMYGSESSHPDSGRIVGFVCVPPSLIPSFTVKQLAQHIVAMNPSSKKEWLEQPFFLDPSKLISEIVGSSREHIRFLRCERGGQYTYSSD